MHSRLHILQQYPTSKSQSKYNSKSRQMQTSAHLKVSSHYFTPNNREPKTSLPPPPMCGQPSNKIPPTTPTGPLILPPTSRPAPRHRRSSSSSRSRHNGTSHHPRRNH